MARPAVDVTYRWYVGDRAFGSAGGCITALFVLGGLRDCCWLERVPLTALAPTRAAVSDKSMLVKTSLVSIPGRRRLLEPLIGIAPDGRRRLRPIRRLRVTAEVGLWRAQIALSPRYLPQRADSAVRASGHDAKSRPASRQPKLPLLVMTLRRQESRLVVLAYRSSIGRSVASRASYDVDRPSSGEAV